MLLSLSISLGFVAAPVIERSALDLPVPLRQDAATDVPEVLPDLIERLLEAYETPPCAPGRAELQRELHDRLAAFEWRPVALELRRRAALPEGAAMRELLLDILERLGTGDEFDLAVFLGAANPRAVGLPMLERSVAGVIAREPSSIAKLERLVILADGDVALAMARAIARSNAPGATVLLAGMLGRNPGIELPMLGLVVSAADGEARPLAPAVCESVRSYLYSKDVQLRREAAQAVGKMGDFNSADALIEMLKAEEKSVRAAAHWSLRELCCMDFSEDHLRWGLWLQTEKAWFEAESQASLGSLNMARERSVIRALDVLREHHYQRFAIANSVAPLLAHNVETVRMKACEVLQELTPKRGHAHHEGCPQAAPDADDAPKPEATAQL